MSKSFPRVVFHQKCTKAGKSQNAFQSLCWPEWPAMFAKIWINQRPSLLVLFRLVVRPYCNLGKFKCILRLFWNPFSVNCFKQPILPYARNHRRGETVCHTFFCREGRLGNINHWFSPFPKIIHLHSYWSCCFNLVSMLIRIQVLLVIRHI